MKTMKMHLALKVHGEDVVIDYQSQDVVFPNRPDESDKLKFERVAAISSYLKSEGFLETLPNNSAIVKLDFGETEE